MRVIHCITSLERGGAQAVLEILVQALQKQGHEQAVIYLHDGPYRERFERLDVPVYTITGLVSVFDPVAFYKMRQLMREIKPDLIHSLLWATNLMARSIARALDIPCVLSLHNNMEQNGFVRNALDRLVSYDGHQIVAVSGAVRESFYSYQAAQVPVAVIENGIDHELLAVPSGRITRTMLGLSPDHFVIGSVGRLVPLKRYPLLLDIFALLLKQHDHARLVIVGTGPQEESLRAYADTLGIAHAVTWVINQPAYDYYSLFDCFALTSAKEGISMALLEAMSCGIVPVVTYDSPVHPVVTDRHNGFVAHGKNATDIASIVQKLALDDKLRNALGTNAQQTVQSRFAKKRMIAAYLSLFEALMQQ